MKKRKIKLKKPFDTISKILIGILVVILIIFIVYSVLVSKLRSIGYSKAAAHNIITKLLVMYKIIQITRH